MTRSHDADLGMFKGVSSFATVNAEALTAANIPSIFTTYAGKLVTLIGQIQGTSVLASVKTLGITATKEQARIIATEIGLKAIGMLYSYASDHSRPNLDMPVSADNSPDYKMQQLQEEMGAITQSFLDGLKDEEVIDHLQNIWIKAGDIADVTPPAINPLISYGCKNDVGTFGEEDYEPGTLTLFQTAIDNYATLSTSPRKAISNRKVQNQRLKSFYLQGNELLSKMDNSFSFIKNTAPDLYNEYQNVRKVVGPLRLSTQILGTVSKITDLELGTTEVVPHAKITITAESYTTIKNKQKVLVKINPILIETDAEGKYAVNTPDNKPLYTVKCTLGGYETVLKNDIKLKRGKKTTVDFLMLPEQPAS